MARNSIEVKISGADGLYDALERQPREIAKKIIRSAIRAAAGIWHDEMKATARRGLPHHAEHNLPELPPGFLADHIGIKTRINSDELGGVADVGPTRKAFWALFLEFGTLHMPAFPFIRRAFESKKEDVLQKYIDVAREKLKEIGLR